MSVRTKFTLIVVCLILLACGKKPTPKSYEYYRIDLPPHEYNTADSLPDMRFDISKSATLTKSNSDNIKGYNIEYPKLNGKIHLTYLPLSIDSFVRITEDCRKLAYKHTIKANSIIENYYLNDTTKVYGVLFNITGDAASSVQFFITDSTRNFLRGALYFNNLPNYDSIMPVSDYIKDDIVQIIETMHWK